MLKLAVFSVIVGPALILISIVAVYYWMQE